MIFQDINGTLAYQTTYKDDFYLLLFAKWFEGAIDTELRFKNRSGKVVSLKDYYDEFCAVCYALDPFEVKMCIKEDKISLQGEEAVVTDDDLTVYAGEELVELNKGHGEKEIGNRFVSYVHKDSGERVPVGTAVGKLVDEEVVLFDNIVIKEPKA